MSAHCLLSRRTYRLVVTAFCAALVTAPVPAHAFEIFGIKLFGSKTETQDDLTIGEPQNYKVDFAIAGDTMEKRLKGASTLWADRDEPASGAAGLIAKARGDYRRLLAALYAEGHYGPTISIRIDGREAADLAPDATLSDPATVAITVDPGPLFHFREAEIVNQAPPAPNRRDQIADPREEGFAQGAVARSGAVLRAERLAVEAWRYQGHAKASVADRRIVAAHDADVIDARITVEPGRKAYYGNVTVEGAERVDAEWIAWMTGLRHGEEYNPNDIKRASTRMARLDLFRAARFQEAEFINDDGLLPITYIVQERKPRRFGVGGTWSSIDGIGVEAFWLHRNLFGRGERLKIEGKVGGIGHTMKPDEFTYRVGASFIKPGVYTPDTTFSATLFGDREVLEAYTRTAVTLSAGFSHEFSEQLSGRLFANASRARFDDDEYGRRDFMTAGLSAGLTYDSRDNAADATRGIFLDGTIEPFYEFNRGKAAVRATAEARAYYGFGKDARVVLAGRVKLGMLAGPSAADLPPDLLFFAGGGGSVRGYAYRNIGVETPTGNVVGGRSLAEASIEARMRVTDSIGVVAFADAGYVGEDTIPSFDDRLRIGVGGGLRYITGLGPIRLDVAMPLDRRPGDPKIGFYVGLGQAF